MLLACSPSSTGTAQSLRACYADRLREMPALGVTALLSIAEP
jgi:hypothetical protein